MRGPMKKPQPFTAVAALETYTLHGHGGLLLSSPATTGRAAAPTRTTRTADMTNHGSR